MDKGEITKGLLDDFSLDDLEKELDSENLGKSHLQGGSGKEIYSVKHKYGALSETKNAPLFTLTEWGGHLRYDLRKWTENGEPGKGITLTKEELEKLYNALSRFDFDRQYHNAIRQRKIKNSTVTFYCLIAELSTSSAKNLIWQKEVNLIDWGIGTRVDFRKWTNDYLQPGKGIRISLNELKVLMRMISEIVRGG